MPVTTRPSPSKVGKNQDQEIALSADNVAVFNSVTSKCYSPYMGDQQRRSYLSRGFHGLPIIASSTGPASKVNMEPDKNTVSTYDNGFVNGIIRAFNQDLHLTIRPDDVWQAILSQFGLFVNGNAERLRHMFVAHKGKRQLILDIRPLKFSEIDLGEVAQALTCMIQKNVVDAELRQWMIPNFSTTTNHDKAVAAFGMMGAMQKYFYYEMRGGCGLPSVTLLGTRDDWQMLAGRVSRLHKYGEECKNWAGLLQPVIRYMLRTFDEPESQEVKDFWLRVAYEAGSDGSKTVRTLSGWITAFAYFQDNGKVTKECNEEEIRRMEGREQELDRKRLTLDGVSYPLIRSSQIPRGIILLPMTLTEFGVRRFATVVSGTIGMSISANGTAAQPVSAWWVVQEFEEPIDSLPTIEAAQSVTGSTTEEAVDTYSSLVDILDDEKTEVDK